MAGQTNCGSRDVAAGRFYDRTSGAWMWIAKSMGGRGRLMTRGWPEVTPRYSTLLVAMCGCARVLCVCVCVENGGCGAWYSHRAWCGASPAICCVCGRWRGAVCDIAWCGASPAICCVCVKNGGCGAWYSHRAWCGASPAICCVYGRWRGAVCVCVKNGGCGAWYSHRAWCGASPAMWCVCVCVCNSRPYLSYVWAYGTVVVCPSDVVRNGCVVAKR